MLLPSPSTATEIGVESKRYVKPLNVIEPKNYKTKKLAEKRVEPSRTRVSPVSVSNAGWVAQCRQWASKAGFTLDSAAIQLIDKESDCNNLAQNPNSTAYGIGQFLDSTWSGVGCVKTSDPVQQLKCMRKYVMNRYSSWQAALAHSNQVGWY